MKAKRLVHADFRALFESAPGLYLVLTTDFEIVAVSDAYLRATMTQRNEILGRGIFEVFPDNPEDPNATGVRNLRASLERVLLAGRADAMAVQKYDIRRPESEGGGFEERYWSPVNSPVITAKGELVYIIHRVEDVTEFIQLKQLGREREKMTEALKTRAETVEAEVYIRAQELAEANRQLRTANEELARLYNHIGHLMAQADDTLRGTAPSEGGRDPVRSLITPEEMLSRVGRLITDHVRLEEQLRQSQKMEAVGRLAGGVAHDFNNLLTVIGGYSSLVQTGLAEGPAMRSVEEVLKATERASNLTKQLLAFSRKQVVQPRVLDLNTVVSGMEALLRRLIGENIPLVTVLAGELAKIKADSNQVEQVIMNLALNARDAMPHGGRLLIETQAVRVGPEREPTIQPRDYVALVVSDTGHGMDAETKTHIFEPFFTTKEPGKRNRTGFVDGVWHREPERRHGDSRKYARGRDSFPGLFS